jgi:lysophospholipase L1-like esterase
MFAAVGVEVFYQNFSGASVGLNDITVLGAVEKTGGTFYPVRFGGSRTAVVAPGGLVRGLSAVDLAADEDFWVRSGVLVASGQKWYKGGLGTFISGEGTNIGANDLAALLTATTSGTIPSTVTYAFRPAAIRAMPSVRKPCVALIGDSIMEIPNDFQVDMTGAGFGQRAFGAAKVPHFNLAVSSESYGSFNGGERSRQQLIDLLNPTHALIEYGTNDINGGSSLASLQASALALTTRLSGRGVSCRMTTITPRTGLTSPQATVRASYNDWLRAGAPIDPTTKAAVAVGTAGALLAGVAGHPMKGVFEMADAVEVSRNSNTWKTSYSTDGVHPEAVGHSAMLAVLDMNSFALGT